MATSSPVSNNNKVGESVSNNATSNGNTVVQRPTLLEMPKPNLRGLNKPKCIKCGNVARSRCPFQSCKSCCSKAQNPCHIHVLKPNSTLPDKAPPSASPSLEQPSTDVPSNGASWRLNSLRQLSTTFANSLRARKPLSRKDALNINKWRFSKLREHIEGEVEAENEAFERYMQNVSLLEEVFTFPGGAKADELSEVEIDSSKGKFQQLFTDMQVKLKANAQQADAFRERKRNLLDKKLRKLQEEELANDEGPSYADDTDVERELKRPKKETKWLTMRTAAMNDLIDKLNKARNEDDLQSCLEMKLQLFDQKESMGSSPSRNTSVADISVPEQGSESVWASYVCSLPKICTVVPINQDTIPSIAEEFSALDQIAEL